MKRRRLWIGLASALSVLALSACSPDAGDSTADTATTEPAVAADTTKPTTKPTTEPATEATEPAPTTEPPAPPAPTGPLSFAMPPGTDDPATVGLMTDVGDLIASIVNREVVTENPADYMAVVEAVRSGFVDVALMSPFSTALAVETGAVLPLVVWKAEQLPASYCLVLADSPIQTLEDLRGKNVAFVDPGSTTGHFMPRSLLADAGLEFDRDYRATFAGGHDTAVLALMNGGVDMACTARQLYTIFQDAGLFTADDVRILAESDPIPLGISIVTRTDLDQATRDLLAAELPDALMADERLAPLLGGSDDYTLTPTRDDYRPLLDVARNVGLNLEDLR